MYAVLSCYAKRRSACYQACRFYPDVRIAYISLSSFSSLARYWWIIFERNTNIFVESHFLTPSTFSGSINERRYSLLRGVNFYNAFSMRPSSKTLQGKCEPSCNGFDLMAATTHRREALLLGRGKRINIPAPQLNATALYILSIEHK